MSLNYDAYAKMIEIIESEQLYLGTDKAAIMIMLAILSDKSGKCIPIAVDEASLNKAIDKISNDFGIERLSLVACWKGILAVAGNDGFKIMRFADSKEVLQ